MIISTPESFLNHLKTDTTKCRNVKEGNVRGILDDLYRLFEEAKRDDAFKNELYICAYGDSLYAFSSKYWGGSKRDDRSMKVMYIYRSGEEISTDHYFPSRSPYPTNASTLDRKMMEEFMDCFVF